MRYNIYFEEKGFPQILHKDSFKEAKEVAKEKGILSFNPIVIYDTRKKLVVSTLH